MILNTEFKIINDSGFFDQAYYLSTYVDVKNAQVDPIEHYIIHGWKEGRNPSANFDTNFYLSLYPDVAKSGMNPLVHYIEHGRVEKRSINSGYRPLSFEGDSLPGTIKDLMGTHSFITDTKNITVITPKHTLYVAHLLYNILSQNGFTIHIATTLPEKFDAHLYIMICPQIFQTMPDYYVAFQMEQLETSKWYDESYRFILTQALAVFDYSIQNIKYLHQNNFAYSKLYHLPIIAFSNYKEFLAEHGHWDGTYKTNQYDILFYGDPNSERRRRYLDALEKKYSICMLNEVFGNELYHALLSSKIVVNIHYYENALLETTRLSECLSLGLKVVSEKSIDMAEHADMSDLVDFVEVGNVDEMIHTLDELLQNDQKVSVVIPCYDQASYLREAVESILAQSYCNIEIIIVNDGSTDNTREVAEQLIADHPHFDIKLEDQKNMGLAEARNTGIRLAQSDYIVPMDADDKLHPQMILTAMRIIHNHDVDIVYGDYQRFGEETTIQRTKESVELYDIQYANVTGATALYKKSVWESTGGYKHNMHGGYEDWELWVNATRSGFKFYHAAQIFFYYRIKAESMYTESVKKHTYLFSKIVMNHAELYTDREIKHAMHAIKAYEACPSFYFYVDKALSCDERDLIIKIGQYVDRHDMHEMLSRQKKTSISSLPPFGAVNLYNLKETVSTEELSHSKQNNKVLSIYYSEIRYESHTLDMYQIKESNYGWHNEKKCILVTGSSFPFSSQNDLSTRLEAYKRSEQYHHEYYQKLL